MTSTQQVKIESLQDLLKFLGVTEAQLEDYFIVRDHADKFMLIQRGNYVPTSLTVKFRMIPGYADEPVAGDKYKKMRFIPKHGKSAAVAPRPSELLASIPLNKVVSLPFMSREDLDSNLAELMEDIKARGQLQPVKLRPTELGNFEVVFGERRVRALKRLGASSVVAVVKPLSDEEAFLDRASENLQREDWSDYEKGRCFKFLMEKFGWTQEQLAKKINKRQQFVSRHIQHYECVVRDFTPRGVNPSELTEFQTRPLASVAPEKRKEIVDEIIDQKDIHDGRVPSAAKINDIRKEVAPESVKSQSEPPASPLKPPTRPEPKPLLTGFEVPCPVPGCNCKLLINHIKHPDGSVEHELEAD